MTLRGTAMREESGARTVTERVRSRRRAYASTYGEIRTALARTEKSFTTEVAEGNRGGRWVGEQRTEDTEKKDEKAWRARDQAGYGNSAGVRGAEVGDCLRDPSPQGSG